MANSKVFLTAEWRKLALAQYAVNKEILTKYLPPNTELDDWQGKYYVSLVGFMFLDVKLRGFNIPFHTNFEEVNLRFYVKYKDGLEWKRGVVFIKEIVPLSAITFVANTIYKEKYQTLPMKHLWTTTAGELKVDYLWKAEEWHSFSITASSKAVDIPIGSEAEFITEHYWGYTKIGANRTSEYGVEHPRWEIYPVKSFKIDVNFQLNYGNDFAFLNDAKPDSVMLAEGSEIRVMKGRKF
ncbi:YqjF family protein [Pedobacter sp. N23S346]|uniref:YqjF family protein n=1 Tax=Pedobacter sp. N23S346 TaxID=3402750 RepID=UPI003AC312F8